MNNILSKDASPEVTIAKIRKQLADIGIFLYESAWFENGEKLYSVRVQDMRFTGAGTNGKGVTKIAALASAYAEFMERIQNGTFLFTDHYGLMPFTPIQLLDKKSRENVFSDDEFEALSIFKKTLHKDDYDKIKRFVVDNEVNFTLFPFYDATNDCEVELPLDIMQICSFSTGMCAGNSPEEAILQGMSEIFERYSIKEMIYNSLAVPTIPHSLLKGYELYNIIEDIEEQGYEIIVKDCSLDDRYPVVGIILYTSDKEKYKVSIGSHINFEIALERCLTEVFQGISYSNVENYMHTMKENAKGFVDEETTSGEFIKFIINGDGRFPVNFLVNHEERLEAIPSVFQKEFSSNMESLAYYKSIIDRQEETIYVRDLSFLGFPSYYIFVTGLSEQQHIRAKRIMSHKGDNAMIRNYVLNLKKLDENSLTKLAELLEKWKSIYVYYNEKERMLQKLIPKVVFAESADFYLLEYHFLLSLLYFRLGRYGEAHSSLESWIAENEATLENLEYYRAASMFFKLKGEDRSLEEIEQALSSFAEGYLVEQVVEGLKDREQAFQHLVLPECGDCAACPVSEQCLYDDWLAIHEKIAGKYKEAAIDQMGLSKTFGEARSLATTSV